MKRGTKKDRFASRKLARKMKQARQEEAFKPELKEVKKVDYLRN